MIKVFYLLRPRFTPKIEFTILKIKLKNNADQNPLTENPGMISAANRIRIALIASRNNPKVKIVIGIVRKIKIGFMVKFNNVNNAATTSAVKKSVTSTPGRIYWTIKTETAPKINCNIIWIASLDLLIGQLVFSGGSI